jgi:hypothetical protein
MQIAIASLWHGAAYGRMHELGAPSKIAYCQRFGYEAVFHVGLWQGEPDVVRSKLRFLANVLPNFDWVVWVDVDCVAWNQEIGLRRFITEAGNAKVMMQATHGEIHPGFMFLRNDPWTIGFLQEWHAQLCDAPGVGEAQSLVSLLHSPRVAAHIKVHPHRSPVRGFQGFHCYQDWNKAFIHLAGYPADEKLVLFSNLCMLAEQSADRRMLSRDDIGDFLNRHGLTGEGAEIGVHRGEYSRTLLDFWEGRTLHLVDAWRQLPQYTDIANLTNEQHEMCHQETLRRLHFHKGRFTVHRALSLDAAREFADASLDFVYIDANHAYEAVLEDLRAWYPKVRAGGLFMGHDFVDGRLPQGDFGVRRAVLEFAIKLGKRVSVSTERSWPTWYFFKD